MKRFATNLILALSISAFAMGSLSTLSSCNKDDDTGDNGNGNGSYGFCDTGICTSSTIARDQCVDAYDACMAGSNANEDDCKELAVKFCEEI